ncbi:MAG TPA: LysM peptidoglycan-binding domain-containing protein [Anaerolineae bacterium]|nr:LysM peptidoglycan-binding domain-containing protein [Anaerolineae bacterium]
MLPVARVNAQQGYTNLLVNGDFEYFDWGIRSWPLQDGIHEVQVCPGWRAYYLDDPPAKAKAPDYWRRPEFRDVKATEYPNRVHGGWFAAKYFSFAGQHEAGFYQQVNDIKPGTPLRFSAYMQTWSCMAAKEWNICPTGDKSNNPAPMHTRIGIDPKGGTDPWSPNVVWSPEIDAYDVWTYFQVEAVAENSTVTVFTYSWADWKDEIFRMHNDVYVDDAVLIALNESQATATPAPTATLDPSQPTVTPAPTATPWATPTPRPDGAVVYVVQAGDTLSSIAKQYRIPIETLLQLNGLTNANLVWIGQELVISVPTATATPLPALPTLTPTPTPLPATPTASPPTAIPPTATLLPSPTPISTAIVMPAASTTPTPVAENKNHSVPWGLIGGAGLLLGIGIGFVIGKTRRS